MTHSEIIDALIPAKAGIQSCCDTKKGLILLNSAVHRYKAVSKELFKIDTCLDPSLRWDESVVDSDSVLYPWDSLMGIISRIN